MKRGRFQAPVGVSPMPTLWGQSSQGPVGSAPLWLLLWPQDSGSEPTEGTALSSCWLQG